MLLGSTRAFTQVKPTFAQSILFLVLALVANVLFAWLAAPMMGVFNEQGLISYLVWPAIMVAAGIILAKRSLNYSLLFVPVILWLAADASLMLFQSVFQYLENKAVLPFWLHNTLPSLVAILFVWQTASLLLIFAKRLHWSWWERLLMIAAGIALLVVWQKNIADQPIFKVEPKPIKLKEDDFYEQLNVLDKQLEHITKGQADKTEWYFLGVAGYADQDVFASEILRTQELFDTQFGTFGRSLSLINNPRTWGSHPLATRTGIERSLKRIAEQMNTEEDVLFLALSSHGSVDENDQPIGELAVVNEPLELEQIDPFWLRTALDDAGIRWRVIVISACYSGTFIDTLKNPYTAIITASRADRPSFGCTDTADMTYFGRAFFEDSLPNAKGIAQAFSIATPKIQQQEILMGFKPSEPQMVEGEIMREALPELEKALFDHANNPKINLPDSVKKLN